MPITRSITNLHSAATPHPTRARQHPGIASPPAGPHKDCAKRGHSFVINELPLFEFGKNRAFGKDCTALSRIYRIIHNKKTLIRINEMFPIDDRLRL